MTSDPYTIYLAGPMTGVYAFNFPLFFDVTAQLRVGALEGQEGEWWDVLSPAEKDLDAIPWDAMQTIPGFDTGDLALYCANSSFTMSNAMEWDLPAIMQGNGIVLLPGWELSTGARWERTVAEALGRDIWLLGGRGEHADPWFVQLDPEPLRLTAWLRLYGSTDR